MGWVDSGSIIPDLCRNFFGGCGYEYDLVYSENAVGALAYDLSLKLNRYLNYVRRKLGKEYWSLSKYLKFKVKNAVKFINECEKLVTSHAENNKVDGVICGHIHNPSMEQMKGDIQYINAGDWMESCTALVEQLDGKLKLMHWMDERNGIVLNGKDKKEEAVGLENKIEDGVLNEKV